MEVVMAIVNNIVLRKNKPASRIFTIAQVQTAFRKLWEEEAHLISENILPHNTSFVGDVFGKMIFSNRQVLKKKMLNNEELLLIERMCSAP
jgi:hypothetical protein